MLRHVRLRSSRLGPGREVVDYRDSGEDPLNGHGNPLDVTGNTWASPPASWPEDNFVGESYVGYREPRAPRVAFVVADAGAWIFAGTHAHNGTIVPGVIASDVDGFNPNAHPANLQILGHSPVPLADSQANMHWGTVYYSDMTYHTDPISKAGIFDSGTNNWIAALSPCPSGKTACPATFVRRVTGNLLRRFGQDRQERPDDHTRTGSTCTPTEPTLSRHDSHRSPDSFDVRDRSLCGTWGSAIPIHVPPTVAGR
jgi:hypothetical protein